MNKDKTVKGTMKLLHVNYLLFDEFIIILFKSILYL